MLRWYAAGLVFLLVISPAVGYGVYRYVLTHPAEPGTLAGRVYEKTVKTKLSFLCDRTVKQRFKQEDMTDEQRDAACKCFVDGMFEKFRNVPPGNLNTLADDPEMQLSARAILQRCSNETGIN
ncbi:MAG: hypothetical protein R3D05_02310 [Dongiaceae bacterium]